MVDERPSVGSRAAIRLPALKGPYQDNGASPWFSMVRVGSDPHLPPLKLNIDTGARFNWITSTECSTRACTMPGRRRFDPAASPSFESLTAEPVDIDFGYWGAMRAKVGCDQFAIAGTDSAAHRGAFYYTTFYDGDQFCELNWDGGIGVPNGLSPDPHSTHLILALLNAGVLSPDKAIVSFLMDPQTKTGIVEIGGFDESAVDLESELLLPFVPYAPGLDYIWTTPLQRLSVGHVEVARDRIFCHDTGSSHFKGDPLILMDAMHQVQAQRTSRGCFPELELAIGHMRTDSRPGRLVLTEDQYVTRIEAGHGQGRMTSNLCPLAGYDSLVLVGSILLDHVCTVYHFNVSGKPGAYSLSPGTTRMFNKRSGPQVICS